MKKYGETTKKITLSKIVLVYLWAFIRLDPPKYSIAILRDYEYEYDPFLKKSIVSLLRVFLREKGKERREIISWNLLLKDIRVLGS